jgi:hypothetical protein
MFRVKWIFYEGKACTVRAESVLRRDLCRMHRYVAAPPLNIQGIIVIR